MNLHDKVTYPVVVQEIVRNSHPVARMSNVKEAVVEVLVVQKVAAEVVVVDPHVRGCLHADGIAILGENLGDLHVANDDILLLVNEQADPNQL